MSLRTKCPHCDREALLVAEALGKNVRCKGCGKTFLARPANGPRKPGSDHEMRAAVKAGPPIAAKTKVRPQKSARDEGDGESQYVDPISETTLRIGLGAIGTVTVLASVLVFVLIANRHPQPQVLAQAPAPHPTPAAKQLPAELPPTTKPAPKSAEMPPKDQDPRPKVDPAEHAPAPKADANAAELYGTQGNEPVAPGISASFTWMRCRAEDTFYRLSDPTVANSATLRRGTVNLQCRIEHRGKLTATHLLVQFPSGPKHIVAIGNAVLESGKISFSRSANEQIPYPEDFECFLVRLESNPGSSTDAFLVSSVARIGNGAVRTMPRDWTPDEIARLGKKGPARTPPAPAESAPKVAQTPPNLYGDQGGEPVLSSTDPNNNVQMRARASDAFYRLSNIRFEDVDGVPRMKMSIEFEIIRPGKTHATHIAMRDKVSGPHDGSPLGKETNDKDRMVMNFSRKTPYPDRMEFYLVVIASEYGAPAPCFIVSNVLRVGDPFPEPTTARDWTPQEIERLTKQAPANLRSNQLPNAGVDTEFAGPSSGELADRYVDPKGHLLGVEYGKGKWMNEPCLGAIRPIFDRNQARLLTGFVIAREGYAVSGAEFHSRKSVNAMKLHFRRIRPDGSLDPNDAYEGNWIGSPHPAAQHKTLGDTGSRVIGFTVRSKNTVVDGISLVLDH